MNGTQTAIDGGINSLCIPRCRFSNEMRWRTAAWSSLFIRQHKIPSTNCLPMSVLLKLFCGCTICWLKIVDGVAGMRPGDKLRTRKSRDDGSATELKKRNIFFCSLAIVPLSLSSFVLKLSLSFFLFIVFLSLSLSFFLSFSNSLSVFLSFSLFLLSLALTLVHTENTHRWGKWHSLNGWSTVLQDRNWPKKNICHYLDAVKQLNPNL